MISIGRPPIHMWTAIPVQVQALAEWNRVDGAEWNMLKWGCPLEPTPYRVRMLYVLYIAHAAILH